MEGVIAGGGPFFAKITGSLPRFGVLFRVLGQIYHSIFSSLHTITQQFNGGVFSGIFS